MTDEYGQVTPHTLEQDAPRIAELLGNHPVFFALADGCGTQVRVTLGPRRGTLAFLTGYVPPVDDDGFLVAIDGLGSTWVQPTGVMTPEWIHAKAFAGQGDGWYQMAAVLAVLLTHIRQPESAETVRIYAEGWLRDMPAEQVPWTKVEAEATTG